MGERLVGYLIDIVIKIAYIIVVYQLLFNAFGFDQVLNGMDDWSAIALVALFYTPVIFYSLVLESLLDGQTIGKRIMKIKVVKIDGYQASFPDFVMRWFLRLVDLNIFSGLIAVIAISSSAKNQRLGDMAAGTAVITLKNDITINHTILENLKEGYSPTYTNVIRLSDNDARIIKDTFGIAKKTRDYATLIKLRNKIIEVVAIKEVQHPNDVEFIETILKDYNYYTQNM